MDERFTCYAVLDPGFGEQFPQRAVDAGRSLTLDQTSSVGPRDQDVVVIGRKAASQAREGLAQRPLDRVALHGPADPAADGDPEAQVLAGGVVRRARKRVEDEVAVRVRAAVAKDAVEVATARQAAALSPLAHPYGVRRLRPLARRRRITSRPERVRIRARKPWVRARLRFFGCQVRFIGSGSVQRGNGHRPADGPGPAGLCFPRIAGWAAGAARGRLYGRPRCPNCRQRTTSEALWSRVRGELRDSLPATTFSLWLDPLRAVSAQGSTLFVAAPPTVRAWVERRYAERLRQAVARRAPHLTEIAFVDAAPRSSRPRTRSAPQSLPLDRTHTFERFVIGPGNRLAHAAALAVAERPARPTTRSSSTARPGSARPTCSARSSSTCAATTRSSTVHYTTAERFTAEFVAALRRDGPEAFKARYRELDALLIDDVQVLEGKQHTEEEFVHTFNTLHAAGKQIVLSSDRPPEALSQLAERLRDRFNWGLRVELEPPDLRTRIAVALADGHRLLRPAARPGASCARSPAAAPGQRPRARGRDDPGDGVRLAAQRAARRSPSSTGRSAAASDDVTAPDAPSRPRSSAIQDAVCGASGLTREELALPRALAPGRPRPPARDVPGPRADLALARRDRAGLRPRPHHRHARDARRRRAPRARLGDRRRHPQDRTSTWG